MQKLLNNLKRTFPEYNSRVNKRFREGTQTWDTLFDPNEPDIYRGVFYIIHKFISDDTKRQLFIRFPSDGIGRSEAGGKNNFSRLECLLADILCLATKTEWERAIACPKILEAKVGEAYYSSFSGGTIWTIKESRDGFPRPSTASRAYRTSEARDLFNSERDTTIKILDCEPDVGMKKLALYAEHLNKYRSLAGIANYSSGILVGYDQNDWGGRPINCSLFPPIVQMTNNYNKVQERSCDLLIFVGDRKYRNFAREINNCLAEGLVKKIIMIGTEPLESFGNEDYDQTFSFSYREMFSYFAKGKFPEIVFHKQRFEWLENKVKELVEMLPDDLEEYDRKRIVRATIAPMLKMEGASNNSSYLKRFIETDFNFVLSPEQIERIISWRCDNQYQGLNPKKLINNNIHSTGEKLIISIPGSSYIKRVNNMVKSHNRPKNDIVIDVMNDGKKIVEAMKALLQNCCLGTYHILSYFDLPSLYKFFNDEIKTYNSEQRVAVLKETYSLQCESDKIVTNNLLDYFDSSSDELLSMIAGPTQGIRQTEYSATFSDGDSVILCGEVIYYNDTIQVEELFANKEEYLPGIITFYKKPENYQLLMEIYYNFSKGQTVADMSELWKNAMHRLYEDRYHCDLELMKKDFYFVDKNKLRTIAKKRYTSLFPIEIKSIAKTLNNLGVITKSDAEKIQAAPNVVGEHSGRAQELKSALLSYRLSGKIEGILKHILEYAESRGEKITAQEIAESSLETKEIIEIQKLNHNRNANV